MKKKEIAKIAGITPQYFSSILNKKRRASTKIAEILEKITGIDKTIWLYPEKHNLKNLLKLTKEER